MDAFKNIVVAIDVSGDDRLVSAQPLLSAASRGALEKAAWVARCGGGTLHVLTSLDVDPHAELLIRRDFSEGTESVMRAARDRVEQFAAPLRARGQQVTTTVAFGRASAAVLSDVSRNARDLVVVGTRERGAVARNILGSTSLQLLRRCPVAVWVARSAPSARISVVLAPVAIGDMAPAIVGTAASLSMSFAARLIVVHAVDPTTLRAMRAASRGTADAQTLAASLLDEARCAIEQVVREHAPPVAGDDLHVVHGSPADVILAHAERYHADLVVLGSVVRGTASSVFLGSTTEKALMHLATSLIVLKPRAGA